MLDGQSFTFDNPITTDITLVASWEWTGVRVKNEAELREAVSTEEANILIEEDFVLSDYITLTKPVLIDGNGKKITVMFPGADYGGSGFMIQSQGVALKNLTLESGETAKSQMALVYIHYASGTEEAPIVIENCNLLCEQNTIGISSTYAAGDYIIIKNNYISDSKYGMYFNEIDNSIIEGNTIDRTKYNGIMIAGDSAEYPCKNVVVKNNTLKNIATVDYADKTYATGIYVGINSDEITVDDSNDVDMYISSNPEIHFEKDGVLVADEESFIAAVNSNKNIILCRDINLTNTVAINNEQNIIINLNGNDITTSNYFLLSAKGENKGGSISIVGAGIINTPSNFTFVIYGNDNADVEKPCNLSIGEDVIIEGPYAISLYPTDKKSYDVNIDIYGKLEGIQPIYVNGNIENTDRAPILNIHDNAVIECTDNSGIYLAGYSQTTIENNVEITSSANAIDIAAGELKINGAIITGGEGLGFDEGFGGSISTEQSSGIYVKQHTTNLPLNVTINSGTISAYIPFYQATGEKGEDSAPNKVSLSVTGGTFISNDSEGSVSIKSDDKTGFITGGTFLTDPFDYVAESCFADKDSDGTYKVSEKETKEAEQDDYNIFGTIAYAIEAITQQYYYAGYYDGVTVELNEDSSGPRALTFNDAEISLLKEIVESRTGVIFAESVGDRITVSLTGSAEINYTYPSIIYDFNSLDNYTKINGDLHKGYVRINPTNPRNSQFQKVLIDDVIVTGLEDFMPESGPTYEF